MISKAYLTKILVDGIPIQSFSSEKNEYNIQIPQEKQSVKIDVSTSNQLYHANLKDSQGKEFPLGSTIQLNETNTFIISLNSSKTEEISNIYKIKFIHSPYITKPIFISPKSRLTPIEEIKSPLINTAKIVGSLPCTDFHYYISTTGERPISFIAENLPKGLSLDEKTGTISGKSPSEKSEYNIKITATNKYGADSINLKLIIDDMPRLTPIQGWSSWYTQSQAISEDSIFKMADAAIKTGINNYGFIYLNIDDCWQGNRNNENPPKLNGKKPFTNNGIHYGGFSNMLDLTTKIHSMGLKIGIYSGPKPSTYAGFLGSSSFNANGMDTDFFSPNNGNDNNKGPIFDENGNGSGSDGLPGVWQPTQYYGSWFPGYESSPGGKEMGKFWFGETDVQQFADWGFDFMKWDWLLYNDVALTEKLTTSLVHASNNSGRSIVLSLSNNVGHNRELMKKVKELGSSMARIGCDINDNWKSISSAAIEALHFIDISGNGFYPDPDMLQIGYIGIPNGLNTKFHKTHLTVAEQYFQLSFWAIYPAPLILSCDLSLLDGDDFTLGLLKNREMILINQDSLGIPSAKLNNNNNDVIVRKLDDGVVAIGVFNYDNENKDITISLNDVSKVTGVTFPKGATIRSVWEQKDVGIVENEFTVTLEGHQGMLYKLIPIF